MYQPAHARFVETRSEALHALVRAHPLGTFITQHEGTAQIDHTPFVLNERGDRLTSHFPRANPVWQNLNGQPVQIIFHGPNAYISPSWYAAKQVHGKVVPTWNYAIVHVQGIARVIDDKAWLRAHLEELTDAHEKQFAQPWKVSDAPDDYVDKLLGAIVGMEIAVGRMEGKFKLGQNRSEEDQRGVTAGLASLGSPLVAMMEAIARRSG